ncbi:MAG: type II toxin-antitoxin system VapC family toxin [Sporichthyaceae bacterium]
MIYLDSCALVKFIRSEPQTEAIRHWRAALPAGTDLITSELSELEITRTMIRAGIDHQRIPYLRGQALRGVHVIELTTTVLARAMTYQVPRLGSLDSIHLSSADPFRPEVSEFVTYDNELGEAAKELGFVVSTPS